MLISGQASGADVDARIARIGLFAGPSPIIRCGAWSFIEVELRTRGERPFEGEVRVDQIDRDGDVITSVLPFALAPEAEWRPYQVFFVPHSIDQANQLRVRIFDARSRQIMVNDQAGVEVRELSPERSLIELRSDDYLILDLSSPQRLPHVAWLDYDRANQAGKANARRVRALLAKDLPSRAIGLEAVDAIVWDDADPTALAPEQVEALIEWVRGGGRLLLTAGKNWQSLSRSSLAEVLPVTITGIREAREAQEFTDLVESEDYRAALERRYQRNPIRRCAMQARDGSIPLPADDRTVDKIAYRQFLGRGVLTFVGASLLELMPPSKRMLVVDSSEATEGSGPVDTDFVAAACERVTARRLLNLPPVSEGQDTRPVWQLGMLGRTDLYERLRDTIGFESVGTAFLLFAVFFAVAYTVAATTGCHWYLKRRGWQHHGWSAFAVVALAASIVGTGMVWMLRGFSTKLWQTTIVDAHAGSAEARATALFGIKTPDHTRLTLRLPSGGDVGPEETGCPIRPAPRTDTLDALESHFAASERYECVKLGTGLDGVPFRATLKEFQGNWHGPLPGKLDARLITTRNTAEDADRIKFDLTDGSYIHNNLGVKLRDCLLFMMPPDTDEEAVGERPIVGGYCFSLGDVSEQGDASKLSAESIRQHLFLERGQDDKGEAAWVRRKSPLPRLADQVDALYRQHSILVPGAQSDAPRTFNAKDEYAACLLLSLYNLMRPDEHDRAQVVRSSARSWDCTHQLTKRSALLIGWSDSPSSAVLERNQKALRPEKSRTVYRFVIPVERT